ncbi:hypothetical protein C2845_PM09G09500 [Panicum miliaceum]|uniref:Uncharacterized protein n=1 Tax=Panicum miliaceum TaxID=4540 RepID=A0A3L6S4C4_PANMI|nr:hypothetical protein C2845_PM09G09500 [Panicum miliaceum]
MHAAAACRCSHPYRPQHQKDPRIDHAHVTMYSLPSNQDDIVNNIIEKHGASEGSAAKTADQEQFVVPAYEDSSNWIPEYEYEHNQIEAASSCSEENNGQATAMTEADGDTGAAIEMEANDKNQQDSESMAEGSSTNLHELAPLQDPDRVKQKGRPALPTRMKPQIEEIRRKMAKEKNKKETKKQKAPSPNEKPKKRIKKGQQGASGQ